MREYGNDGKGIAPALYFSRDAPHKFCHSAPIIWFTAEGRWPSLVGTLAEGPPRGETQQPREKTLITQSDRPECRRLCACCKAKAATGVRTMVSSLGDRWAHQQISSGPNHDEYHKCVQANDWVCMLRRARPAHGECASGPEEPLKQAPTSIGALQLAGDLA